MGTAASDAVVVLVVDDDAVNRLLVTDLLEDDGYRVRAVTNGADAIAAVHEELPALVLMDVQMPVMDGLEATRRLKADPTTRDVPVVALTALGSEGDERRCLDAGCDAYLAKPIRLPELLAMVAELVTPG